ncbi:MAG TPA: cytochrome c oxidase assembly protein [Solirubrobacteraceae bacterium]|nr:cytochrome c oxidase assembly protein [Solirubrobacteraceae bacterium]
MDLGPSHSVLAATVDASWSFEPGALLLVALLGFLYARRLRTARTEARARARGSVRSALARDAPLWRAACFAGALVALLAALISPIDSLGHQVLVMHMVQHLLLLDIVPILGILGFTRVMLRPVTRHVANLERALGPLAHPVFAALLYVSTMVFWHIPTFYDAALRHDLLHALEHITFGIAGALYWWHLLSPIRGRHRLSGMGPIIYMLGTKFGVGLLGIVITFAPRGLYDFYAAQGTIWGMDPHTDQQVAGALMAVEQSIVMGIALAWLFVRMLDESQRNDERAERYGSL